MFKSSLLLPLLLSCILDISRAQQNGQCYAPDGSLSLGDTIVCNATTSDGFSSCCGIADACTSNGLCKWPGFSNNNLLTVNGCTDRTWRSSNCVQFCKTDPKSKHSNAFQDFVAHGREYSRQAIFNLANKNHNSNQFVFACSETTYCCSPFQGPPRNVYTSPQSSNFSCCSDPIQVFDAGPAKYIFGAQVTTSLFPATATTSTTSTTASGSQTSSTTLATTSSIPSPTTTAAPSDELSTGAKAGIGIGAAFVGIAGAGLVAWLVLRSRRRQAASPPGRCDMVEARQPPAYEGAGEPGSQTQAYGWKPDASVPSYAQGNGPNSFGPSELDATRFDGRRELP